MEVPEDADRDHDIGNNQGIKSCYVLLSDMAEDKVKPHQQCHIVGERNQDGIEDHDDEDMNHPSIAAGRRIVRMLKILFQAVILIILIFSVLIVRHNL